MVYAYIKWSINHEKRNNVTCSNMDGPRIILSEVRQKEQDKYHMISLICEIYTMTQMNLFTKHKHTYRHRDRIVVAKEARGGGGIEWKFGISRCELLYIR